MIKYFDKENNRLVYIGNKSNSEFWDKHWEKSYVDKLYKNQFSRFDYVLKTTKKYLPTQSLILEGGCGLAQQVNKLQNANYKVIGIDFAEKTVEFVNQIKPDLDIRIGDVRKLDFSENYFDAYWSFGVIEHFYNGYDDIGLEMFRVIKKKGYLFITFPHLSRLRKNKIKNNKYPIWEANNLNINNFYQFALDKDKVLKNFEKIGFKHIQTKYLSGIKGLKDEIKIFHNFLQKIFDSNSFIPKILAKIISIVFNRYSSHTVLLILQKK